MLFLLSLFCLTSEIFEKIEEIVIKGPTDGLKLGEFYCDISDKYFVFYDKVVHNIYCYSIVNGEFLDTLLKSGNGPEEIFPVPLRLCVYKDNLYIFQWGGRFIKYNIKEHRLKKEKLLKKYHYIYNIDVMKDTIFLIVEGQYRKVFNKEILSYYIVQLDNDGNLIKKTRFIMPQKYVTMKTGYEFPLLSVSQNYIWEVWQYYPEIYIITRKGALEKKVTYRSNNFVKPEDIKKIKGEKGPYDKIRKWKTLWTFPLKVTELSNGMRIVEYSSVKEKSRFFLNIFNKDGKLIYKDVETNLFLIGSKDNKILFVNSDTKGGNVKIEIFQLKEADK